MKKIFKTFVVLCAIVLLGACGDNAAKKAAEHGYAGKFSIEDGISFELNNDSTAVIHFDNGEDYDSTWKIVREKGEEWANIEFAGDQAYYYLKDGKLYRSHLNMDKDYLGWVVTYED